MTRTASPSTNGTKPAKKSDRPSKGKPNAKKPNPCPGNNTSPEVLRFIRWWADRAAMLDEAYDVIFRIRRGKNSKAAELFNYDLYDLEQFLLSASAQWGSSFPQVPINRPDPLEGLID
jgi:hypothetical protein